MTDPIQRNRENALAFYDLVFNRNQPRQAVAEYLSDAYIHHNPDADEGKAGFLRYCEWLNRQFPGKRAEFLATIGEGDLVVVYTSQIWPNANDMRAVDFFRFDSHGKIIEHWDVTQEIEP